MGYPKKDGGGLSNEDRKKIDDLPESMNHTINEYIESSQLRGNERVSQVILGHPDRQVVLIEPNSDRKVQSGKISEDYYDNGFASRNETTKTATEFEFSCVIGYSYALKGIYFESDVKGIGYKISARHAHTGAEIEIKINDHKTRIGENEYIFYEQIFLVECEEITFTATFESPIELRGFYKYDPVNEGVDGETMFVPRFKNIMADLTISDFNGESNDSLDVCVISKDLIYVNSESVIISGLNDEHISNPNWSIEESLGGIRNASHKLISHLAGTMQIHFANDNDSVVTFGYHFEVTTDGENWRTLDHSHVCTYIKAKEDWYKTFDIRLYNILPNATIRPVFHADNTIRLVGTNAVNMEEWCPAFSLRLS